VVWRIGVERRDLFVERASGAEAFRKAFVREARWLQLVEQSVALYVWMAPIVPLESIYEWIRDQASRGIFWIHHLRFGGQRRKRYSSKDLRGRIRNRTPISERPDEANERTECGHWECDTMEGRGKSGYLVTMTDRRSRLASVRVVRNKSAPQVRKAITQGLKSVKGPPVRTITTDNGKEFADHETLARSLHAKTYFANPYSSWERGSNENMNGLLRQYYPKGTDFRTITPASLAHIERKLNNRPRKCLGFQTPVEVHYSPNKT
jgi:IS30 family transposase